MHSTSADWRFGGHAMKNGESIRVSISSAPEHWETIDVLFAGLMMPYGRVEELLFG